MNEKDNTFIAKCMGIGILILCIGFLLGIFAWRRDFRKGIYTRLDIAVGTSNRNQRRIDHLEHVIPGDRRKYLNTFKELYMKEFIKETIFTGKGRKHLYERYGDALFYE